MILAATGHRPGKLGGYSPHAARALLDFASYWLLRSRPDEIISGMAQGWDTAIALAAIHHGIPLTAALPFATQANAWPSAARARYGEILAKASRVVILSPVPQSDAYTRLAMQTRNRWMVDNCSELVALWDGSPGGTKHCVEYAMEANRLFANPWHEWRQWWGRLAPLASCPPLVLPFPSTAAQMETLPNE